MNLEKNNAGSGCEWLPVSACTLEKVMSLRTRGLILSSALVLGASCGGQSKPSNSTPESIATESSTAGTPSVSNDGSGAQSPGSPREEASSGPAATSNADPDLGASAATTPASPSAAPLNDQQIAKITDGVNSAEIAQAQLAQKKSKNREVLQFAAMMIQHHGQAKKDQALLKIVPQDSPLAQQLETASETTLASLKEKTGADFDRVYFDAQVEGHQKALDTLKRDLEPAAQDPALRSYLQKLEPRVVAHLSQAQSAQQSLQSSNGSSGSSTTASAP
jgi:putative membrane protein